MAGCKEGRKVVKRREGVGFGCKGMSEMQMASVSWLTISKARQTQEIQARTSGLYVLRTLCISILFSSAVK